MQATIGGSLRRRRRSRRRFAQSRTARLQRARALADRRWQAASAAPPPRPLAPTAVAVLRWAARDALCARASRLPPAAILELVGWKSRPRARPARARARAAIALARLRKPPDAERTQAALARGLALALPRRLATPRVRRALLSAAECDALVAQATAHAAAHGWGSMHRKYPTTDIAVADLACGAAVRAALHARALPAFAAYGAQFGPAAELRFRDLFVAKYDADAAGGQRGLDGHIDCSFLSMVLQLNPTADFEGGGTRFEHRDLVVRPEQGDGVLFLSKLYHEGVPIRRGTRYIWWG